MLPLPFVDGFVPLGVFLFLSGFAISPTLIAAFAWIEETVPAGRLTEGITLFTTGLAAGLAPGAALVGLVVDALRGVRELLGDRGGRPARAPACGRGHARLPVQRGRGHRPADRLRERRAGGAHQQPLGERQVGQQQLRVAPTPASARPRQPPARRRRRGRAAAAAGCSSRNRAVRGRPGVPRSSGRKSAQLPRSSASVRGGSVTPRASATRAASATYASRPSASSGSLAVALVRARKLSISATCTQRSRCGSAAAYGAPVGRGADDPLVDRRGSRRPSARRPRRCRRWSRPGSTTVRCSRPHGSPSEAGVVR